MTIVDKLDFSKPMIRSLTPRFQDVKIEAPVRTDESRVLPALVVEDDEMRFPSFELSKDAGTASTWMVCEMPTVKIRGRLAGG